MQSGARIRKTICAIVSALIACVVLLTYEAPGRFVPSSDTGRPHDLINNPDCWAMDDERSPCDLNK
jgi:hypothetical protein